jgi:hypothetical protein
MDEETLDRTYEYLEVQAETNQDFYELVREFEVVRAIHNGADPAEWLESLVKSYDPAREDV